MTSPLPKMRLTTPPFPSQDLVNKFIAATPSYMYTPIVGQQSFYFSELLRSLSQAKRAEMMNLSREALAQQHLQASRRIARKRPWGALRPDGSEEKSGFERPLELTSKNSAFSPKIPDSSLHHRSHLKKPESPVSSSPDAGATKHFRYDSNHSNDIKPSSPEVQSTSSETETTTTEQASSTSNQDSLILPPPPPVWYPPLYSPYANLDPANFFVDLRVSGHIFERKRELAAAQALKANNNNLPSYFDNDFNKNRIGSAFSIPKSREGKMMSSITGDRDNGSPSRDGSDGEMSKKGPSYFSLPKIYDQYQRDEAGSDHSDERPKKFYDNGITVYNVDSDEESGDKKMDQDCDSDDDETIAVDEN